MDSENSDGKYRCPCGAFWPCICLRAMRLLHVDTSNVMGFDKSRFRLKVGECECPRCTQTVHIYADGNDVTGECQEHGKDFWQVDEVGFPPTAECCGLLFVIQPMGDFEVFELEERP